MQVWGGEPLRILRLGTLNGGGFPTPAGLADGIAAAIAAGATTYPPMEGLLELREAIIAHTERTHGLRVPIENVLVASGARPFIFGTYQCVLDPGDVVVCGSPAFQTEEYSAMAEARSVAVDCPPERGFMPSVTELAPFLREARLLSLNSPLNPTGTVLDAATLGPILALVVEENRARLRDGRPPLFVPYDQVYSEPVYDGITHLHPAVGQPEAAPWIVTVDAITKNLAATGLRVGWGFVPPALVDSMRDIVSQTGAWAPTPIQLATARFLVSGGAARHREAVRAELQRRMRTLVSGLDEIRAASSLVDYVAPQAGLFVAVRFPWIGRRYRGVGIENEEEIRRLLLDRADVAFVPFSAFSRTKGDGWFRASVGAVDAGQLEAACHRIRAIVDELG